MQADPNVQAARAYELGGQLNGRRARRSAMRQSAEYKAYRRYTRPFRGALAGIITRIECERFLAFEGRRQARLITTQVNTALEG